MAELANKQEAGFLDAEFMQAHEVFYKERFGAVYLGCGDDRGPTVESSSKLGSAHPEVMPTQEGYASVYGGLAGVAKNVIVTGVAQYGPSFVDSVGGFDGVMRTLLNFSDADTSDKKVVPTLHSAQANEHSSDAFSHTEESSATGCAYAGGVGATAALLVDPENPHIREIARRDQETIFGKDDEAVDALLKGQKFFADTYGPSFAVDRKAYIAYEDATEDRPAVPIMILAGAHTKAAGSGVITNFDLNAVGDPVSAHAKSHDFYREDLGIAAEYALRAFASAKLDPELLLRSFQLDSTPVRAVLVSHDSDPQLTGKLDPQALKIGVRGDVQQTISALQQL